MTCISSIVVLTTYEYKPDKTFETHIPRFIIVPNKNLSGIGTTTLVLPCSAKYTINKGIEAMMGIGSLCRHRMSKTSSRKPSIVAMRIERIDDKNTDS